MTEGAKIRSDATLYRGGVIVLKRLPVGVQDFRKIRKGGYVYADKTNYVYRLLNDASYYFLSRPRRFGKSLLLDTIAEAFSGDKELFKGLYIYDTDWGFEKYPIIRFDMSKMITDNPEDLRESLVTALRTRMVAEDISIESDIPGILLQYLIEALCKKYGKRVVVLVDEYDKPILDKLTEPEVADKNRDVIKSLFGVLKGMDACLEFTFFTGVSKFTKTSLFSDLNNLSDITLIDDYANICGIPVDELGSLFDEHIKSLEKLDNFKQYANVHDEIIAWYDGYSWDGKTRVINPFSLLRFFQSKKFYSFWFASGSPTFLLKLIKDKPSSFHSLGNLKVSELAFDACEVKKISPESLMFQTGYLTVKEVLQQIGPPLYVLDIPNLEVREALNLHVLAEFTENDMISAQSAYNVIKGSLETGDLQGVLVTMRALLASIPYRLHVSAEVYYHSIFVAIMTLLGFDIKAEVAVSGGIIDAVLELDDKIYVVEFKYKDCDIDATPETRQRLVDNALRDGIKQIKDRGYSNQYIGSGKTVYHAAFAFLGKGNVEMLVE